MNIDTGIEPMDIQDLHKMPRDKIEELLKTVERPFEIMNDITKIQTRINEMSKNIGRSLIEAHDIFTKFDLPNTGFEKFSKLER